MNTNISNPIRKLFPISNLIRNTVPRKGVGTRRFTGQVYYYAGRTLYPSKALSVVGELRSLGIKSKITMSRAMGSLIWTSKPVYLDLSEQFVSSRGYYNPSKRNPIPVIPDVKLRHPTKRELTRWKSITDPFAEVTEKDRKHAWGRGVVI